ncbi:UTP--glucose-1-phosphate uridylyltransferase [Actinoplanes sp. NEAU-A12]|uniref:UTP--glucose-1-phosphate uridylyltransferase n=1 Tax=Actinoplanes sandaracinus TaxID=3045177 RepID=A0ABT6WJB5_9ACTN|nr:UTP--glucose-1-phosphate uridylyltransferase [Actinoplanes sandaracinus]MDI6099831.1 UTP--glucose-1-phosphate uridylyltransferase [Actinoplanes sandaracinus]
MTTKRAVKAVIPAAGLATRFLPATKAVPKELLPVVDRPVLQYIVEEAAAAGITDVLLVTGRGKTAMVDHFDRRPDVEARLEEKGDHKRLAAVRRSSELADIYTVRQGEALGLGHAVGTAAAHVGDNAFAVLLGDEFVEEDKPLLPAMIDLQAETGGIVLAFMEVAPHETSRYGIASVRETGKPDVVEVTGLVEKPSPEEAPSNLAVLGRYVLPASIFDVLAETKPGNGGEIQLTDAMATMLADGVPVHGIVYRGHRYDTGMPLGYLQAVVELAVKRDDLGEEFLSWLTEFVGGRKG